jgi:NAD(P)-dependent dehydrogenase (short-subunit alcohol dehydrogenase family)
VQTFGNNINVLVNNAAIANPYQFKKTLEELSLEEWNKYISTNISSVFLCSKYAIPFMKFPNNGSIINIASIRAMRTDANGEAYSTTKGGVIALTHSMAISFGKDKIRVNSVAPGWIDTTQQILTEKNHAAHPLGTNK